VSQSDPVLAETEKPHRCGLRAAIEDTLEGAPRSGCPCKSIGTPFVEIIAMACDTPEKYGVPLLHWTDPALAQAAVRRPVVAMVSARQGRRYNGKESIEYSEDIVRRGVAEQQGTLFKR